MNNTLIQTISEGTTLSDREKLYNQKKLKLEEEGLFDQSYKKELPRFPKTVGVVTSKTGAAIRDIINVIKRRSPGTDIIIYPASVQGSEAHHEIAEGIEYFNKNNCPLEKEKEKYIEIL